MMGNRSSQIDTDRCVVNAGGNRFELVLMASARAREIRRQHASSQRFEHIHPIVTALQEFENATLDRDYIKKVK